MKIKIKCSVNGLKVANKEHMTAKMLYPTRITKNKKAYDRKKQKIDLKRTINNDLI